jgi:hypothetical protein
MDENPDRNKVIELLEKLGDADDTEVISSARELHQYVSGSGLTWDNLLVPDGDAVEVEEEDDPIVDLDDSDDDPIVNLDDSDDGEEQEELDEVAEAVPTGEAADDLKLIDQLLGGKDTSSGLREELEGYKEDIKEGDFTTADRTYLQALQKRITAKPKARVKG